MRRLPSPAATRSGPLHGLPVPIKDLNATKGIRTTRGSRMFKDDVPDEDDVIVERVKAAGGIIIGKTNTPEFGHRGTTEHMIGEPCRNPWNVAHTPGGSSGGRRPRRWRRGCAPSPPAADGGGSIRIPASFSGIFGIKPTQGRVARLYPSPGGWGQFGQNGPMSRNVRDSVLLFQVLAGPDLRDPTCIQEAPPNFADALDGGGVKGLRIGWERRLRLQRRRPGGGGVGDDGGDGVQRAWRPRRGGGPAHRRRLGVRHLPHALRVGQPGEQRRAARQPCRRPDAKPAEHDGDGAPRTAPTASWRALHELEWHRARMDSFFDDYDLLLSPTMAVPAFRIEEFPDVIGGRAVDPMWGYTPFTYPINMSGQTASSVPWRVLVGRAAHRAAHHRAQGRRGTGAARQRRVRGGAAVGAPPAAGVVGGARSTSWLAPRSGDHHRAPQPRTCRAIEREKDEASSRAIPLSDCSTSEESDTRSRA